MADRTLYDIIEAAKDGERPEYDELLHGLLVLTGLLNMTVNDVDRASRGGPMAATWVVESHRRYQQALNAVPRTYLGNNVPGNPEYERFRAMGKKLLDKAIEKVREGQS